MTTSKVPFADPLWLSRGISPYYNNSHRQLQKETRAYVDAHILPFCEQWERQGSIPPEAFAEHARRGYMATAVYPLAKDYLLGQRLPGNVAPKEWDGFHQMIVLDEVARCGYLGVVWGLTGGNAIGAPPLVNHGNEQQKQQFLPSILSGKTRFCLAITEPDAGSDVAGITTTAERKGDKYIVNGAKKWITNGMFADYCTTAVRTGGKGRSGISALIIPLDAPGVTRRKMENSGVYASGSTYIEFDNVEVALSNLIGRENHGFEIIMSNFDHERLCLACISLRLARCCIEDAYVYASKRETFGRPLLTNQVIRSKFSASGRKVESAHALMEQLVYMAGEAGREAHMGGLFANLKVVAAQVLEFVNREAQQTMGGVGYSRNGRGARVEQISRDVRVMVIGGGSEEILTDLAFSQEERALAKL
ncbi:Acyl-CoA dehydrogenase AFT10-1 [Cladobotryum mycophilum]|uniref:Acyl-CoA dehydrogenase AFT10-1 n=1 Tax=Cladobotryum mycophilum TaxID=491253 RepID=A0ABR0SD64_9HYPO